MDNEVYKTVEKYKILKKNERSDFFWKTNEAQDEKGRSYFITSVDAKAYKSNWSVKKHIDNEIRILSGLKHEAVVGFIEQKQIQNTVYIITEFCNQGSIEDSEAFEDCLSDKRYDIVLQLMDAFKYLSGKGVMHCNLKPENIFRNDGRIKLRGFGFARAYNSEEDCRLDFSLLGRLNYASPEIVEGKKFTEKCDIWSLGVLIYEMVEKRHPYCERDRVYSTEELLIIFKKEVEMPPAFSERLSRLLRGMLKPQEKSRYSWEQVWKEFDRFTSIDFYVEEEIIAFDPIDDDDENTNPVKQNAVKQNVGKEQAEDTDEEGTKKQKDRRAVLTVKSEISHQKPTAESMYVEAGAESKKELLAYYTTRKKNTFFYNLVIRQMSHLFSHRSLPLNGYTYMKCILSLLQNFIYEFIELKEELKQLSKPNLRGSGSVTKSVFLSVEFDKLKDELRIDRRQLEDCQKKLIEKLDHLNRGSELARFGLNNNVVNEGLRRQSNADIKSTLDELGRKWEAKKEDLTDSQVFLMWILNFAWEYKKNFSEPFSHLEKLPDFEVVINRFNKTERESFLVYYYRLSKSFF